MFKKQDINERGGAELTNAETVIGPSVKVKGDFNSDGDIIVEGIVRGNLKTKGSLRVGDKAQVKADIEAKNAKIGGEIKGNVKIKNDLELTSTARIYGDVETASLAIERGAILNGKCTMTKDEGSIDVVEEKFDGKEEK